MLPGYDTAGFYRTRSSFLALALAVLLGWFAGGIVSTLFGFVGLGGEILRPAAIFGAVWLEDYLSTNPRARRIMLAFLGMGMLTRYAAALAAGMVRFTSFASLRSLIFGSLPKINIFKATWLWFGALIMFAFFAKKQTGFDSVLARESLTRQIEQQLALCVYVFFRFKLHTEESQSLRLSLEEKAGSGKCPLKNCGLAETVINMLDTLKPDQRHHLGDALAQAGYDVQNREDTWLIWNAAEHEPLYNALGLVRDGDKCIVLSRPYQVGNEMIKGTVQRMPGQRV